VHQTGINKITSENLILKMSMSEEDLEKIIEKLINGITKEKCSNRREYSKGDILGFKVVTADCPHGVYVYNKNTGIWELVGEDYTMHDGYYVMYFDNTYCPACRIFDFSWYIMIETLGKEYDKITFIIVHCGWFTKSCESKIAREFFKKFDIHSSPTILLLRIKNGEVVRKERMKGSEAIEYLAERIEQFMETD